MLMLLATLVAPAHADGLSMPSPLCNGKPCGTFIDIHSSIMPPDLYESMARNLGGTVPYFRVDLQNLVGEVQVEVNGYLLDARLQSAAESVNGHLVYYVPASPGAKIYVENPSEDPAGYDLEITAAKERR